MALAAIRLSNTINMPPKINSLSKAMRTLLPPSSPSTKAPRRRSEGMRLKPSRSELAPTLSLVARPAHLLSNSEFLLLNQATEAIKLNPKPLPLKVISIPSRATAHSNPLFPRLLSMVTKLPTKDTQHQVPRSPRQELVALLKESAT
jgi:hypothetical protein